MKSKNIFIALGFALVCALSSCAKEGPIGPVGPQGDTGLPGQDGKTPYIGSNGNWWIGDTDTGVKATGDNGQDGKTPYIGSNGNWIINGIDTGIKATGDNGQDGKTPYIGSNGNWWVGDTDTGVKATGDTGLPGQDGKTPYIGSNGNWWIGDTDTGISAITEDMDRTGTDGLHFELVTAGGKAGYEVTKYTGTETNVIIPNYVYGKPVISIAKEAFRDAGIEYISISNQMVSFNFEEYSTLKSIDINHANVDFSNRCFYNCVNLREVTNYENVNRIGDVAFYRTAINDFNFANIESIGSGAFLGTTFMSMDSRLERGLELFIYIPETVREIGGSAFDSNVVVYYEGNINDTEYVLGNFSRDNVKIYDGYYYQDNGGTDVSLITYIGNQTKLVVPSKINGKTVTSLLDYSFMNFRNVEWLELPNTINTIGSYTFCGCPDLAAVFFPKSIISYGDNMFEEDYYDDIIGNFERVGFNIPYTFFESSEEFEFESRFSECARYLTGITSSQIIYNDGNLYLNKGTYYEFLSRGSKKDEEFAIPNRVNGCPVTKIYTNAFYYDFKIRQVDIPNSITKIYPTAFYYCPNLVVANVPTSVELMNHYAFYSASKCIIFYAGSSIPSDWDSSWYYNINSVQLKGKGNYSNNYLFEVNASNQAILTKYYIPSNFLDDDRIIEIPSTLKGYTVTGVAEKCFDFSKYGFTSDDNPRMIIPTTITTFASSGITFYGYPYVTILTYFENSLPTTWASDWIYSTNYSYTTSFASIFYKNQWGRDGNKLYSLEDNSDGTITLKKALWFLNDENIIIPGQINGKTISAISSYCFDYTTCSVSFSSSYKLNIVIPSMIKTIEYRAFYLYRYPYANVFTYFEKSLPTTWDTNFIYGSNGYGTSYSYCKIYFASQWQFIDNVPTAI